MAPHVWMQCFPATIIRQERVALFSFRAQRAHQLRVSGTPLLLVNPWSRAFIYLYSKDHPSLYSREPRVLGAAWRKNKNLQVRHLYTHTRRYFSTLTSYSHFSALHLHTRSLTTIVFFGNLFKIVRIPSHTLPSHFTHLLRFAENTKEVFLHSLIWTCILTCFITNSR